MVRSASHKRSAGRPPEATRTDGAKVRRVGALPLVRESASGTSAVRTATSVDATQSAAGLPLESGKKPVRVSDSGFKSNWDAGRGPESSRLPDDPSSLDLSSIDLLRPAIEAQRLEGPRLRRPLATILPSVESEFPPRPLPSPRPSPSHTAGARHPSGRSKQTEAVSPRSVRSAAGHKTINFGSSHS